MKLEDIIKETVTTDWKDILLAQDLSKINEFLTKDFEMFKGIIDIYPPQNLIFNAFNHFNFSELKIVLIGQDPYINPGEAMGMCFSVPADCGLPPSLKNIYKEIESDIGTNMKNRTGDLTGWAKQGILLLNSALTVRQGKSNSHQDIWMNYTNGIIEYISQKNNDIIFILWGNNAKSKKKYIDSKKHFIIEGVHPSPLSAARGFFGCKHFSKCNQILSNLKKKPINW